MGRKPGNGEAETGSHSAAEPVSKARNRGLDEFGRSVELRAVAIAQMPLGIGFCTTRGPQYLAVHRFNRDQQTGQALEAERSGVLQTGSSSNNSSSSGSSSSSSSSRSRSSSSSSAERIERQEALGFQWALAAKWGEKFALLEKYKAAHNGDTNPPYRLNDTEYPGLGKWVNNQRQAYSNEVRRRKGEKVAGGIISAEQIERLEALGFQWDPLAAKWGNKFALLEKYKAAHNGDTNPPRGLNDTEYPGLGIWVDRQRKAYNNEVRRRKGEKVTGNERISAEQIERLQALGFQWDPVAARWGDKFALLEKYKAAHNGDTNPPRGLNDTEHPGLGIWVDTQRKAYNNEVRHRKGEKVTGAHIISAEQIQRLEALGFQWRAPRAAGGGGSRLAKKLLKATGDDGGGGGGAGAATGSNDREDGDSSDECNEKPKRKKQKASKRSQRCVAARGWVQSLPAHAARAPWETTVAKRRKARRRPSERRMARVGATTEPPAASTKTTAAAAATSTAGSTTTTTTRTTRTTASMKNQGRPRLSEG